MKKMTRLFACAGAMTLLSASAAFGGTWQNDGGRWWYDNGDGTYAVNGWQWIDGNGDGAAECYYFDESGYCLTDTITPDGYTVDANGAWTVDGQVQYAAVNTSSAGQEEEWYQKLYQALKSNDFAYVKQELMAGEKFIEKCQPYRLEDKKYGYTGYCIPMGNGENLGITTCIATPIAGDAKSWDCIMVFVAPAEYEKFFEVVIGYQRVHYFLNWSYTEQPGWLYFDGWTQYGDAPGYTDTTTVEGEIGDIVHKI